MVQPIGDQQLPTIQEQRLRVAKSRCPAVTAVSGEPWHTAGTSERLNVAARSIDPADHVIVAICQKQVSAIVEGDVARHVEESSRRQAAIARVSRLAGDARHTLHPSPVRIDPIHGVERRIHHIQPILRVDPHLPRLPQLEV
jgi:hypothetical protein